MVATRASRARAGDAAPPARSPSPKTRKVRTKDAARVASPSRRATSPKPRKSRKESAPGSKSNTEAAPAAGADVAGWAKSTDELVRFLGTSVSKGLSPEEAARRLEQYGPNELQKDPPTPLWKLVLEQFEDLLVRLLLMAAVVSFALAYMDSADGEEGLRAYIEPLVILLILVLNAVVGVWQETNAEAALDALKEMQADRVRCTRGGKVLSDLDARELVPGDVVTLAAGDRVPADCRLVSMVTTIVRVDQAALTGESQPVNKEEALVLEEECDILSKENMLFSGTALVSGSCKVVVCSTGMGTEIGAVQAQIQTASEEDNDTPLKRKLDEFGTQLAKVISLICLLVWGMNYSKFLSWTPHATLAPLPDPASIRVDVAGCTYYFKIAVALAVAAIPEGLPAVITTCLALGTRSMAKKKAIVRRLPSVETLGCTTVICSDKTGTLTTNQMTCVRLVSLDDKGQVDSRTVSGQTYDPEDGAVEGLTARTLDAAHLGLATVGAVCNDAHIERDAQSGLVKAVGTPTEACLVTLAEKIGRLEGAGNAGAGPAPWAAAAAARAERIATLEFDRDRKSMSVLAAGEGVVAGVSDGGNTLLCKGAAECVLERCDRYLAPSGKPVPMSAGVRKTLAAEIEAMASQALRTLALAARAGSEMGPLGSYDGDHAHPGHKTMQDPKLYPEVESKMVFLGMVGIQDPPRAEVAAAIQQCRGAGVRVMVITGDNKLTAEAIARKIGVLEEWQDADEHTFTGSEFMAMDREERLEVLMRPGGKVFSRAEPRHKQEIVRCLKEDGEVTAMTGDGINDAPALKLADIGVAMGITGTEVAKEASDMVLADDNFSTIVAAVEEGRAIYDNMKAFIRYMISSNVGEVASILITALLGLPESLIPVQLLWVNLVTDGFPATALSFNPPEPGLMNRPPRDQKDGIITPLVLLRWFTIGIYVGLATVGIFGAWFLLPEIPLGPLGRIPITHDGHTNLTWHQLTHWTECATWTDFKPAPYTAGSVTLADDGNPCAYFEEGLAKPSTLALSVLVLIEMLNAMNAVSENNSLLRVTPLVNPLLCVAIVLSLLAHLAILHIPFMRIVFRTVELDWHEWMLVLAFSVPVMLIDEVLKTVARFYAKRGDEKFIAAHARKKND